VIHLASLDPARTRGLILVDGGSDLQQHVAEYLIREFRAQACLTDRSRNTLRFSTNAFRSRIDLGILPFTERI
jgi:hypothetical protein